MALEKYNMIMPRQVFSGVDAMANLKTVVKGCKKAALYTDKVILSTGLVDLATKELDEIGIPYQIIDEIPPEPTYMAVQAMVEEFRKTGSDVIIAMGGGSVIDSAKLASVLTTDEYTVHDLLDDPLLGKKMVRTCIIPTTAGTGAEATPNAIVAVPEKELKIGIVNPEMVPDYVILDYRMIKNLPRSVAAATGIDAMAHAIECYTSNKANPFSDMVALEAFDLILNNIVEACDNPEAVDAKIRMQLAAFYGGVAITCSGTTAVHALSYPLGGKYHIAHGVSNAIMLMPVMRFNEPAIKERLAKAYDRAVHVDTGCTTVEEKSHWLIEKMGEIVRHLDIPTNLSKWNVSKDDLETLTDSGMEVTRLLVNNMREVTREDARMLYSQVLE